MTHQSTQTFIAIRKCGLVGKFVIIILICILNRFGQPHHDELTIIAPLSQCCTIRQSTLRRLLKFNQEDQSLGGNSTSFHLNHPNQLTFDYYFHFSITDLMKKSLSHDPVNPVLSEAHFTALDRRVKIILQSVRDCISQKPAEDIINFDEL